MSIVHTERIDGPTAWKASDFKNNASWHKSISETAIAELKSAVNDIKDRGLSLPNFTKDDFPLPTLSTELASYSSELETGCGFILLKGIPVDTYPEQSELDTLLYGIGLHMGEPVRQNPEGDLIGKVINTADLTDRKTRVYETNAYLPYHSDPSDLVGLLCVRPAKTGGISSLISSTSLYNEMLEWHREYLSVLYRPMIFPHVGEKPCLSPIYSYHQGQLSCRYMRQYLELGHDTMGFPLSSVEIEAFDRLDDIMQKKEMRIDMMMQPGDLQLVNNYTVLHSRTSFEDYEDLQLRRKKLRLWLKNPFARQLGYEFPGRDGFPNPG